WKMLYLGGVPRRRRADKVPGCRHLEFAYVTTTHAVACSQTVYDKILQDVPATPAEVALWLRDPWGAFETLAAIDWYYLDKFGGSALIVSPIIATQMNLLPYEN